MFNLMFININVRSQPGHAESEDHILSHETHTGYSILSTSPFFSLGPHQPAPTISFILRIHYEIIFQHAQCLNLKLMVEF